MIPFLSCSRKGKAIVIKSVEEPELGLGRPQWQTVPRELLGTMERLYVCLSKFLKLC